ncbi:MOSC domain-containing protein [Desertivirga brevis]|uniref:MOSC domain-containing protein n=1 Tax=Desertivirga brevis TaxID=2810310 RepID=UPI001A976182|nr:MOSC domain-containing protein [Pedobacter sp. SYSU D00873]
MNIQDLYIYPIKSLGGIRITEGKVLQKGFELDRRFMLVDEAGKFVTQRVEHKLALLQTSISNHSIQVRNKLTHESLEVPFSNTAQEITVTVWDDVIQAVELSEELNEWFSDYLRKPVKLVYQPEIFKRPVDQKYARNDEQVSFADAFPFLLISQASLDDLNARLETPVPMNRFRPNLVVQGTDPYEEDSWTEIQIGKVNFLVAKPCARCVLTTVDQETAIKGKEPLATLAKYRTVNSKVMFGQNLIALNEGTVQVGDTVKVISRKVNQ